jgi:dihydrofolate reductase
MRSIPVRKITAATFLTLDGVMEAPGSGDITLPNHRGWSEPFMTPELGQLILNQMDNSDAMLLGRVTYQGFAAFWPSVPDSDPFGKRMNGLTKYVVSTTLDKVEWKNSQLIKGNIVEAIAKLKQQPGGNISITGSGTLIRTLLQHDLIDEYQISLCPVVLGVGKRLFGDLSEKKVLKLVDSKTYSTGMLLLTYRPDGKA